MPTIDAHAHLVAPDAVAALAAALPAYAPRFVDRPAGRFLLYPSGRESGPLPEGMTDLAARLADLDRTGVDVQVLSPSPPQFGYALPADAGALQARIVNDATLALADRAPGRLLALLTLPAQDPVAALAELDRAGGHPAVRGVEIGATIADRQLDDPELEELWAALAERRAFVLVHPNPADSPRYARHFLRNLVGNPADTTLAAAALIFGGVLERHPDLRVCFVHGGGFAPYQIGRWERGWQLRPDLRAAIPRSPREYLRQCYFDTLTHDDAALRLLGAQVGWDRVVLGSDYCFDMASDDPVAAVRRLELPDAEERAVLGGTLADLLHPTESARQPVGGTRP